MKLMKRVLITLMVFILATTTVPYSLAEEQTNTVTITARFTKSSFAIGEPVVCNYSITGITGEFYASYHCMVFDGIEYWLEDFDWLDEATGTITFMPEYGSAAHITFYVYNDDGPDCEFTTPDITLTGGISYTPIVVKMSSDKTAYQLGQTITVNYQISGGTGKYDSIEYYGIGYHENGTDQISYGTLTSPKGTISYTPKRGYMSFCWIIVTDSVGHHIEESIALYLGVKSLKKATVSVIADQAYTGKAIQPKPTITIDGKTLREGRDYKLTYKNNKDIGTATVTIKANSENYVDSISKTFKIIPKKVTLSSLKPGSKKMTVKWKKDSKVTGYQIQYSTKKDFKSKKSITVKDSKTIKTEIKKLTKGNTDYVRIRSYKTVGKEQFYSAWSTVLKVKIK